MYTPPFTITSKIITLVADISAQIERYSIRSEMEDTLHLRKTNRIKTIHSSLAIEGNKLTESQVSDVIDGKHVVAPPRDIQEVKNAIATYDMISSLNPFDYKDLLKAHGAMMNALVDNAGKFRSGGVGVFEGGQCIHLAPPADRVQFLISDLFKWLQDADDHLLIKSCVFHYEFEFIHPFDDGNGRMGRLWQSLILGKLHPLFLQLPVENIVYTHQQDYYSVINKSTEEAQCGSFIEFMLEKILETLKSHQGGKLSQTNIALTERQQKILELLNENVALNVATNVALNSNNLAEKLGVSRKTIERDMTVLQEKGLVQRVGSNKTGHWELVNTENTW